MESSSKKEMGIERVYLRDTAEIQLPNAKSYSWETFGRELLELSVRGGSFIFAQFWRMGLLWSVDVWTDCENDYSNFWVLDLWWKVSLYYLCG